MFKFNKPYISSLEVCIRNNIPTYSAKIEFPHVKEYLEYLKEENAVNTAQYNKMKSLLAIEDYGYVLFNWVSSNEFRIYITRPNLFGYHIDDLGNIVKEKEYIDDYYINLVTNEKKKYIPYSAEGVRNYDIQIPTNFVQAPIRGLADEVGQVYFEFLSMDFIHIYIEEIENEYTSAVTNAQSTYSLAEISTWEMQYEEAEKFLRDSEYATCFLDEVCKTVDEKIELANKIVDKNKAYRKAIGAAAYKKQQKLSALVGG